MMLKLKHTEVREYRLQQLQAQNNSCALCGETIIDDAVLDHDHKSGLVRQVLHRGCNSLLGKIENAMPRSQMTLEKLAEFSQRLIGYISTEHTQVLHPTYKTKEERHESIARKRIKNREKQKRQKQAAKA